MIVVGVVTYSATFNLNNIVQFWSQRYEEIKNPIIKKMSEEEDQIWQQRASLYSGFRPRRENSTPSEWWVLWYLITYPFMPSHARKLFSRTEDQNGQHLKTDAWASEGNQPQHRRELHLDDPSNDAEWMKGMPDVKANAAEDVTRSTDVQRTSHDELPTEQIRTGSAKRDNSKDVIDDERADPSPEISFLPVQRATEAAQPAQSKTWMRRIFSSKESQHPESVHANESTRDRDPVEQV